MGRTVFEDLSAEVSGVGAFGEDSCHLEANSCRSELSS